MQMSSNAGRLRGQKQAANPGQSGGSILQQFCHAPPCWLSTPVLCCPPEDRLRVQQKKHMAGAYILLSSSLPKRLQPVGAICQCSTAFGG